MILISASSNFSCKWVFHVSIAAISSFAASLFGFKFESYPFDFFCDGLQSCQLSLSIASGFLASKTIFAIGMPTCVTFISRFYAVASISWRKIQDVNDSHSNDSHSNLSLLYFFGFVSLEVPRFVNCALFKGDNTNKRDSINKFDRT